MSDAYAVRDVHDQDYDGMHVVTIASPFGAIRVSCDDIVTWERATVFVRKINGENITVAVIPASMPYMFLDASLMKRVTEEDMFQNMVDEQSRQRIYMKRMEAFNNGENSGSSSDHNPSFD